MNASDLESETDLESEMDLLTRWTEKGNKIVIDTHWLLPRRTVGRLAVLTALLLGSLVVACEAPELLVPDAEQVESYYTYSGQLTAEVTGNVAEITITQPAAQLRRGGRLWAKVGPYVLLFSQPTQQLFTDFQGLAGVRVITRAPGGQMVAQAMLRQQALNELTWKRALNVSGLARRDGTKRPTTLETLVLFGEDRTEFEYSSRYVR